MERGTGAGWEGDTEESIGVRGRGVLEEIRVREGCLAGVGVGSRAGQR